MSKFALVLGIAIFRLPSSHIEAFFLEISDYPNHRFSKRDLGTI